MQAVWMSRSFTAKDREHYCSSLITGKSAATAIDIDQATARMPPSPEVFVTPPHQTGHLYALHNYKNGHLSYTEASHLKSPTEIEVLDSTGNVIANITNTILEDERPYKHINLK
ncbi:hypothetical protein PCASD_08769 [Puccinia coronata f. sp. avenae]|uniref:Uncharacterized protein n=1 Tax=Puccinia coronata f. sp. avenae TaxID=200324 RepID=A0A2N5UPB9_9BASI|nr:hypothetical protein PCASD_17238 [Puccinia coronata f. sp. avenae]PLW39604.1 hypothetical protein PCASD_08769 [Puccinia coronata f. sp. avenae]